MPLVSIIIPTHNRARYAIPTIRSALSISELVEVVVSDTSPVDEISPIFSTEYEKQLKIIRPEGMLSVVDNFNAALKAASGKFLVFIGDDDFIDSSIIDVAQWALRKDIDAVRCTFPASYYWPDFSSQYFGDGYSAKLAIQTFSCKSTTINAKVALESCLNDLGGGVGAMPRAYLGLLSRELILDIESKYGPLFGGVSPDIYSAALISYAAKVTVELDYPFIIPGSSGASTSGQSASGGHKGALRDNDHLRPFKNLIWNTNIPEFYSVPTVWSYSIVKAAEKLSLKNINYERLYVKCFIRHPEYIKFILSAINERLKDTSYLKFLIAISKACFSELYFQSKRLGRKILKPSATGNADAVISNLNSSEEAGNALKEYLKLKKLTLD